MKRTLLLAVVICLIAGTALSQPYIWRGSGGWGAGSEYDRLFKTGNIVTLTGRIVSIDYVTPVNATQRGVMLALVTPEEKVEVHLGPAWFIENQDLNLLINDTVTVTGARTTFMGKDFIIASKVEKGNEALVLRSENGRPVWSAWGRKDGSRA